MHNHNKIYSIFILKSSVDTGLSHSELVFAFLLTCLMFNIKENIVEIIDEMIENGFIYLKNDLLYVTKNKKFLSYKKHIDLILQSQHSYSALKNEYVSSDEEETDLSDDEEEIYESSIGKGSEKSIDEEEYEDIDTFHIVKSDTTENVYYIIDLYNKECSCPSFKYCKKTEKTCKHIDTIPVCIITSNLSTNKHTCDCGIKKNGHCIHIKNFISYYELDEVIETVDKTKIENVNKNPKSTYIVQSMTDSSKSYTINLDDHTCTCPSFTYCKLFSKTCKHLK